MNSWRDILLQELVPGISRLTLVADPDRLLEDEGLAQVLHDRGFELLAFQDPVEFRFAFESRFRKSWDRDESSEVIVAVRNDDGLGRLPFDLLCKGRKLRFSLSELFPKLSYPILQQLDQSQLDLLFLAIQRFPPDEMGDSGTKDYLLRLVFAIDPVLVNSTAELLKMLLRVHYGSVLLPAVLRDRLVAVLSQQLQFASWSLEELFQDELVFYAFLQERWQFFLEGRGAQVSREGALPYGCRIPGPEQLPFDHHDVRVYIDNLFLEGKLKPLHAHGLQLEGMSWIRSGLAIAPDEDQDQRLNGLFNRVEELVPGPDALSANWVHLAQAWAEATSLVHGKDSSAWQGRWKRQQEELNTSFAAWLHGHFAGLIDQSPAKPVLLHHVPRYLARQIEGDSQAKVALVVLDGLALDQWCTLRTVLSAQMPDVGFRESALLAWIPTLTSVSRQALFAGKAPQFFPASIANTNSEVKWWKLFWESQQIGKQDVLYARGLGASDPSEVMENVIPGKTRVIGLVVDMVDKIMHGMQLGSTGMHNQIRQWAEGGYLSTLLLRLMEAGFQVWLTADHGNIECTGQGRPSEGSIAETRGERVRVYPTKELRSQVSEAFPFASEWQAAGLPEEYHPLVATGSSAFVRAGERLVGHGGISLEEVLVPWVKLERSVQ